MNKIAGVNTKDNVYVEKMHHFCYFSGIKLGYNIQFISE